MEASEPSHILAPYNNTNNTLRTTKMQVRRSGHRERNARPRPARELSDDICKAAAFTGPDFD